jgi:hypothetical protein
MVYIARPLKAICLVPNRYGWFSGQKIEYGSSVAQW